ncbi:hypothetical protein P8452_42107 [Trifolium repens]|nr:hypothetical protein P8452_42107 [Trifolium repens]
MVYHDLPLFVSLRFHFQINGLLDLHQRDLFPYNLNRTELLLDIALLALNQGFLLNVLLFLKPRFSP